MTLRIFTNLMGSRHGFVTKDQCLVGSGVLPPRRQVSPLVAGWWGGLEVVEEWTHLLLYWQGCIWLSPGMDVSASLQAAEWSQGGCHSQRQCSPSLVGRWGRWDHGGSENPATVSNVFLVCLSETVT